MEATRLGLVLAVGFFLANCSGGGGQKGQGAQNGQQAQKDQQNQQQQKDNQKQEQQNQRLADQLAALRGENNQITGDRLREDGRRLAREIDEERAKKNAEDKARVEAKLAQDQRDKAAPPPDALVDREPAGSGKRFYDLSDVGGHHTGE